MGADTRALTRDLSLPIRETLLERQSVTDLLVQAHKMFQHGEYSSSHRK
jgi:hypothetical protein